MVINYKRKVCQNHIPYCKVNAERKYTLLGGLTTVVKKFTIRRRGGLPGMVKDLYFKFFWAPPLRVTKMYPIFDVLINIQ